MVTRKLIRAAVLIVSMLAAGWFLWQVRSGLYPFIIALFLAYLLNPAVCWLEGKGCKRVWAIVILYVVLFGAIAVGGSRLIPLLVRELESFGQELPTMTAKSEELLNAFQQHYQQSALPASLRSAMDNGLLTMQLEIQAFVTELVNSIVALLSKAIGLVISPVLAFYLLHDWPQLSEELLRIFPARWQHEASKVACDVDKVLSGVIRGQLTIAVVVGVLVSTGLYWLDVRYAVLIGILAGALDIIPYFGAIIGATPAVTVALLDSPALAVKVAILFFLIHQTEGTVIGPRILGEKVGLHPLAVIFFLFVGEELGGLLGMLLGVPAAAVAKVLAKHLIQALI